MGKVGVHRSRKLGGERDDCERQGGELFESSFGLSKRAKRQQQSGECFFAHPSKFFFFFVNNKKISTRAPARRTCRRRGRR
jgi:hypothetical protein